MEQSIVDDVVDSQHQEEIKARVVVQVLVDPLGPVQGRVAGNAQVDRSRTGRNN